MTLPQTRSESRLYQMKYTKRIYTQEKSGWEHTPPPSFSPQRESRALILR